MKTYQVITELEELGKDPKKRGDVALLRRGLMTNDGNDPLMYQVVYRLIHAANSKSPEESYLYDKNKTLPLLCQVAALFTLHPSSPGQYNPNHNLGHHLRYAAGDRVEAAEKRFKLLLSVEGENLFQHLKHAVGFIGNANPPININYHELFLALNYWNADDQRIQKKWAQGFWG